MSALLTALKRKYKTPSAVLEALGLSPCLLAQDAAIKPTEDAPMIRKPARDNLLVMRRIADANYRDAKGMDDDRDVIEQLWRDLVDGKPAAWKFVQGLGWSDSDLNRLRDLVLREPDLDRAPDAGEPDDRLTKPLLAGDSVYLPEPIFRALAACRHIRTDLTCVQDARATRRMRIMSAQDSRSHDNIYQSFAKIAPGALRIRLS